MPRSAHGGRAVPRPGRIHGAAQRHRPAPTHAYRDLHITGGTAEHQYTVPPPPADLTHTIASFLSSLLASHSHLLFVQRHDGPVVDGPVVQYRWWHPPSASWIRVELDDNGGPARVHQSGPRRLWADLTPLLAAWDHAGRPGIDDFGLTVTAQRHTLWISAPDSPHHWTLPS